MLFNILDDFQYLSILYAWYIYMLFIPNFLVHFYIRSTVILEN